jgi:hypothetical protein
MFQKKELPFWCPQLPPFHGISFQTTESVTCHSEGHQCRWKINIGGRGACMQDHDFFPKAIASLCMARLCCRSQKGEHLSLVLRRLLHLHRHVNRINGKCFLWWIYRNVLLTFLNYLREIRSYRLERRKWNTFIEKKCRILKGLFLFWCRWTTKIWKLQGNGGMKNVQFSEGSRELLWHLVKVIIINKFTYLFMWV